MRARALVDTLAPGVNARDTAERETPARLATSAAVTNARRTDSSPLTSGSCTTRASSYARDAHVCKRRSMSVPKSSHAASAMRITGASAPRPYVLRRLPRRRGNTRTPVDPSRGVSSTSGGSMVRCLCAIASSMMSVAPMFSVSPLVDQLSSESLSCRIRLAAESL